LPAPPADRVKGPPSFYRDQPFATIDHAAEKRDADAILHERLLRIARSGEKKEDEKKA
jgi:hypothetical protein